MKVTPTRATKSYFQFGSNWLHLVGRLKFLTLIPWWRHSGFLSCPVPQSNRTHSFKRRIYRRGNLDSTWWLFVWGTAVIRGVGWPTATCGVVGNHRTNAPCIFFQLTSKKQVQHNHLSWNFETLIYKCSAPSTRCQGMAWENGIDPQKLTDGLIFIMF